jgi:hypothetical protein
MWETEGLDAFLVWWAWDMAIKVRQVYGQVCGQWNVDSIRTRVGVNLVSGNGSRVI